MTENIRRLIEDVRIHTRPREDVLKRPLERGEDLSRRALRISTARTMVMANRLAMAGTGKLHVGIHA